MTIKYDEFGFIKKPNTELEYSKEDIDRLTRCSEDFYYFLSHVTILHPDDGRVEFIPRKYQRDIFDLVLNNNRVIICSGRQQGKTVSMGSYSLWYAIFRPDSYVAIGSNSARSAQDFLQRIKLMYEELDEKLKPGITKYNETSITFENGSTIQTAATSKAAFRGRTITLLILDEFAHLTSDKLAAEFWASNYPAVSASKDAKIIIASTPKGLFNLFGQLWDGAVNNRNEFKYYKTIWSDVEGRDEKWKEDQLKNMNNDMVLFNQEFECSFVGSISTVIDPEVLKQISNKYIQPITKDLNGKLFVYEKPIDGCVYVIGADTAKGTGEHYSSTQILKVISLKPIKLKQVAVFNDNMVDVYKYAEILNRLGVYYNGAWIICENNAEGSAVVNQLWWELEYSKLYNCGSKTTDLGIRATRNTKPKAVLLMKKLIEDYSLELLDRDTLEQLNDYSEKSGKFTCNNLNDDLVSALYWATYALTLDILDESFEFGKKEEEDDVWGILTDSTDLADWTWLNTPSII
ncbi:MAG: terminase family protein [Candidatus Shapirobacteria bacterium]